MNKKLLSGALALSAAIVLFAGCTVYTGIAVKDKKAIISVSNASAVVCDIESDGMLANCKTN